MSSNKNLMVKTFWINFLYFINFSWNFDASKARYCDIFPQEKWHTWLYFSLFPLFLLLLFLMYFEKFNNNYCQSLLFGCKLQVVRIFSNAFQNVCMWQFCLTTMCHHAKNKLMLQNDLWFNWIQKRRSLKFQSH